MVPSPRSQNQDSDLPREVSVNCTGTLGHTVVKLELNPDLDLVINTESGNVYRLVQPELSRTVSLMVYTPVSVNVCVKGGDVITTGGRPSSKSQLHCVIVPAGID